MKHLSLKNRRDQKIIGTLKVPSSNPVGTVVLQHGYGSVKESPLIASIEKAFLDNGLQVFNFDSPNSLGESEGVYEDARLGLHADDFDDVIRWVLEQQWMKGKLLVSGHSMGGFASMRFALRNPSLVGMIVSVAPVISGKLWLEAISEHQKERLMSWLETGFFIRESRTLPGVKKISPYDLIIEAQGHSLLEESTENPNLLLIGFGLDTSCLEDHLSVFYKNLSGRKSYQLIPGVRHSPKDPKHLSKVYSAIDIWLKKEL